MALRRQVALIIDPGRPYDRRIVRGVAAFVQHTGCDWMLYVEEDPVGRLPDLDTWAGDGIIADFDNRRVARAVSDLGIPVVAIGGGYGYYDENSAIPYVRTDNRAIAELAAGHLLDLGFRRFAFCSEPANRYNGWAQERAEAFADPIRRAGFACDLYMGRHTAARHWREMQTGLQDWLTSLISPVGLMACNDVRARHVLEASHAAGLRVPEDIAIVGVDNDDIMCELTIPPLSSIEQGTRRIGYEAASILDAMMKGANAPRRITAIAPEELVARQSTDVVAIDDEDVATALKFIRRRACDPIRVRDVLAIASVSRSTLEAKFRELLGRSIHAEIHRIQIDRAQRLLTTTSMPIKEVACQVGVPSVQYFTAMFRQATGQTPGKLRKSTRI